MLAAHSFTPSLPQRLRCGGANRDRSQAPFSTLTMGNAGKLAAEALCWRPQHGCLATFPFPRPEHVRAILFPFARL